MKVSILVVAYNHAKYIRKAIESILMQDFQQRFEIIFADDCSSDDTVEIASALLDGRENSFVYRNEQNLGITGNYQISLPRCRGEYVFVLEGDDYWTSPLKLKTVVQFMDNNQYCAMCAHTFFLKNEELNILTPPAIQTEQEITLFENKDLISDMTMVSNISTFCFRSTALLKLSPEIFSIASYEWMINIAIGQFGFLARMNTPMSVYRVSDSSLSAQKSEETELLELIGMIDEYDRVLDYKYNSAFLIKKKMLMTQLMSIKKKRRLFWKK